MQLEILHPADQIIRIMNRIVSAGLTSTRSGNLSVRDSDGTIWITPEGLDKGEMTSHDIVQIGCDQTATGRWEPSHGLFNHNAIYQAKPTIQAVIHAHAPALTAFAMIHELPTLNLSPNLALQCAPVRLIPYGSCDDGKKRAALLAAAFRNDYKAVLVENHGVYVAAESITKAYRIFETLEKGAASELIARRAGEVHELSDTEVDLARTIAHTRLTEFQPRLRTSEERALRRDLVRMIRRAVANELFGATYGTISARLSDGSFLITPFGTDRFEIDEEDLILIRRSMKETGKTPSRAVFLHELIYHKNPDVRVIISTQPPYMTILSVLRRQLDVSMLPECQSILKAVPIVPYGQNYNSPQTTAGLFSNEDKMILLENDGVIVTGATLAETFDRLEEGEAVARATLSLPKPFQPMRPITEDDYEMNGLVH